MQRGLDQNLVLLEAINVNIYPFHGFRPQDNLVAKVNCPPWDVVSPEEAREFKKDNPYSLLHITLPETTQGEQDGPQKSYATLRKFMSDEVLIRDPQEALYVYEIKSSQHTQIGLIGAISCQDYVENRILKHENTIKLKEENRAQMIAAQKACVEPVFLFCADNEKLDQLLAEVAQSPAEAQCRDEAGCEHRLWLVTDPKKIKDLQTCFENMAAFYIADGHHRSAGATRNYQQQLSTSQDSQEKAPWAYMMAAVFPESQIQILPYNRVVKDLNQLSSESFLAKLKEEFTVEASSDRSPPPHHIDVYFEGQWWRLIPKEFQDSDLDAQVLQDKILGPILGIQDPRHDKRIDFIGGDQEPAALEALCQKDWALAFNLHPTTAAQIKSCADANQMMPPKSTWFDPKLRSGLLIYSFED